MDHFAYQSGELYAEGVPVAQIAAKIGTPFYCYSTATLVRHYRVFAEALAAVNPLICFAMKSNSNRAVVATLGREGAGVDVVSEGEIRVARSAGIAAQKIVFSGVGKTREEMAYALSENIFQFNVESEAELLALNEVAASKGVKAPIALRVNPDVDPQTHAKISTGQKESKFGIAMSEALRLYQKAHALPHISVQGISVHIGSQLTSLEPFRQAFRRVRALAEELMALGIPVHTLDFGGGLGIPYDDATSPPLPSAYGEMVAETVRGMDCKIIFEPGRMIAGNAGILVSRVIYTKQGENRRYLILDAAMNDLIRPSLYDAYHELVAVKQPANDAREPMDIVGPVCETGDLFAEQRPVPPLAEGDLVAFRSCGAYGAAMACNYNSRLLVPEVIVNGDIFSIVRPRQTYEDLLARDALPSWITTV